MLSDGEIQDAMESGHITIEGVSTPYIGPASVDLHLDNKAMILNASEMSSMDGSVMDVRKDNQKRFDVFDNWNKLIVLPGEFYILSTREMIGVSAQYSGFVHGRSSLARLGLNIHMAGFVDPGFKGNITLEVTNFTKIPIALYSGMRIGQIVFMKMDKPSKVPYSMKKDAKYQRQMGPTLSLSNRDNHG